MKTISSAAMALIATHMGFSVDGATLDWTGPPTPGRLMSEDYPKDWMKMHREFTLEPADGYEAIPNMIEVHPDRWYKFDRKDGKKKINLIFEQPIASKIASRAKSAIRLKSSNCACLAEIDRRGRFTVYGYHEHTQKYLPIWDNGVSGNTWHQEIQLGMNEKFDRMEWTITDSAEHGENGGAKGRVIWSAPGAWWNGDDNHNDAGVKHPRAGWFELSLANNCELAAYKQERVWKPQGANGYYVLNGSKRKYWSTGPKIHNGLKYSQSFCYGPTRHYTKDSPMQPPEVHGSISSRCFDQLGKNHHRCLLATEKSDDETRRLCQSSSGMCGSVHVCDYKIDQLPESVCNTLIRRSAEYVKGAACDLFYDQCWEQCGACQTEAELRGLPEPGECGNKGGDYECKSIVQAGKCYDPQHVAQNQKLCAKACGYCSEQIPGSGRRLLDEGSLTHSGL